VQNVRFSYNERNDPWSENALYTATDAKQNFAALLDDAQREPVMIRRQSRDQVVVISPQEYARLRGLAVVDYQAFCDRVGQTAVERGLTERKLASLLRTDD
jgi:antitoxin Phd